MDDRVSPLFDRDSDPAASDPPPSAVDVMSATYNLRVGDMIALHGEARATPAGLLAFGFGVAAIILAVARLRSPGPR